MMASTPIGRTTVPDLHRYLVESHLAGDILTTRESNTSHAARFAAGVDAYLFGLPPLRPWSYEEVIALMAERAGIDPDHARRSGADTIDPNKTVGALDRFRERVAQAAERKERVILASGHPHGVIEVQLALVPALERAGCAVLTPAAGRHFTVETTYADADADRQVSYLGGVATCADRFGVDVHSHSPVAMELMLKALASDGADPPDLVIADHGFAGAAAAAGIDVVCFADSNDPGLFVGEAEGRVLVTVPIDDNLNPRLYDRVSEYVLEAL
jgi:Phosphatase